MCTVTSQVYCCSIASECSYNYKSQSWNEVGRSRGGRGASALHFLWKGAEVHDITLLIINCHQHHAESETVENSCYRGLRIHGAIECAMLIKWGVAIFTAGGSRMRLPTAVADAASTLLLVHIFYRYKRGVYMVIPRHQYSACWRSTASPVVDRDPASLWSIQQDSW